MTDLPKIQDSSVRNSRQNILAATSGAIVGNEVHEITDVNREYSDENIEDSVKNLLL